MAKLANPGAQSTSTVGGGGARVLLRIYHAFFFELPWIWGLMDQTPKKPASKPAPRTPSCFTPDFHPNKRWPSRIQCFCIILFLYNYIPRFLFISLVQIKKLHPKTIGFPGWPDSASLASWVKKKASQLAAIMEPSATEDSEIVRSFKTSIETLNTAQDREQAQAALKVCPFGSEPTPWELTL